MAQFIQSQQLSPVQGTAGQQSVVTRNGPTFGEGLQSAVQNIGGVIDTAGTIYGERRAKELVNEEIENIDRARGVAESGQFTAGDPVPESLKMDQKEWDMMAAAVQSGSMSREKARLMASARLRKRIAEEPFFAGRMRRAASGLLGFNIESEGAQQYFSSFQTQAQLAEGSGNEIMDKYREQAEVWKATGVIDNVESGIQYLAKLDRLKQEEEMALLQAKAGVRSANDMANVFIQANNSKSWGSFLGDVKATEAETGKPITPETFKRKLDQTQANFIEKFDNAWVESGGDLNSEDYNRHLSRIENEYGKMKEFADAYGIDNILKLKVDRQEQLFDLMGMEMFPQFTMITRTFGQQVTSDLLNALTMNKTKRDLFMKNNPELRTAFEMMDSDPKQFTRKMSDISSKILNGEELEDEDTPWVNGVATELHRNGTPETKEGVMRGLSDMGLNWKGLSLAVESRAYLEPEFTRTTFKTMYEEGMPATIEQLAIELQAIPGISANVGDDGRVTISTDIAGGAMPQTGTGGLITNPSATQEQIVAVNRARQLADKINLFSRGMERGYDKVVGTSKEKHVNDVRRMLTDDTARAETQTMQRLGTQFIEQYDNGDTEAAKTTYENLKRRNPDAFPYSWEEIQANVENMAETLRGE